MILTDIAGIIADDLTGANDTALQFHRQGAVTKILLDSESIAQDKVNTEVRAFSSESRNVPAYVAVSRVESLVNFIVENFAFDYYYKKIDSTLRGHIALETLSVLNILDYDAAIIVPAFPQEGRITVGGYHLSKGIPIGKTEIAIDPHSPITESHVPTLLTMQLGESLSETVGTIDLRTILNGAGPILVKINELINEGKRLIVADATSLTDIEQIALAIKKCDKKLLPTGTAAMAQVLSKYWLAGIEKEEKNVKLEKLPKFIVSGTATKITANQIQRLEDSDDFENINFIPLNIKNIIDGVSDELVFRVIDNLRSGITVCIHTSKLMEDFDGFSDDSFNADLTKDKLAGMVTDYLGEFTKRVMAEIRVILITLGGETSYKCCNAISANELTLEDEVLPAISLCKDANQNRIITKSGNLGNSGTLIDILNYLECHE
ncbi:MAG: four-carbon acid sugar kinase family protein [bacterium]|nr:four-carbon acid sugar kinase family protein [bacterium]